MLMQTFQYRLYPTKERQLWNTQLTERKSGREQRQETVDYDTQKAELPGLKGGERPVLGEVHSGPLPGLAGGGAAPEESVRRLLPPAEGRGDAWLPTLPRRQALYQPDLPAGPNRQCAGGRGEVAGGLQGGAQQGAAASPAGRYAQDRDAAADGDGQVVRDVCL
ncbi:MAG TPA: hypothetical protein VGP82_03630 [Ktedonobacterales bacterium]|nr:hypothetical protein [Ktedonobacterales bacterium]